MSPVNLPPLVRHMLLCEDVGRDPANENRIAIFGLTSIIRSLEAPPFPLTFPLLCVYLVLTDGRGEGEGQIVAVAANEDAPVFASPRHHFDFTGTSPLDILAATFRIRDCIFPRAGLYWIEFRYNGQTIAREPLVVR